MEMNRPNQAATRRSFLTQATSAAAAAVQLPRIAFKVLAAGAIRPELGFSYPFGNGADFICLGMFDFQGAQDAALVRSTVSGAAHREREWLA